jgi:hypothetical protein
MTLPALVSEDENKRVPTGIASEGQLSDALDPRVNLCPLISWGISEITQQYNQEGR